MARVTISPRMPVGPQGAAAPEVQIQYSADGTNWHNTPQSGDMYLRFSTDGGDTWGESIRLAEVAIDNQITDGVTDRAPSQNAVYDALQALVEDQITDGVTDKAPSQNAVYDALHDHTLDTDNPHNVIASQISIADAGDYFTATDVENALQELASSSGDDYVTITQYNNDFTSSKATNGYQKLPSGLIIQWGYFNTPSTGSVTCTFPMAFPNACYSIATALRWNSNGDSYASQVKSVSTSNFVVRVNDANKDISWIAIGY